MGADVHDGPGGHRPAQLRTIGGAPVLRFERRLRHSPERVWRAVTDPAELRHWFPAEVEAELRVGAPIRFTFPGEEPSSDDPHTRGEILEFDPPKVFAFRWSQDVLRFELVPDGDGCLLVMSHTVGGGWPGRLTAGRSAGGWDVCLDALEAGLAGREPEPPGDVMARVASYLARFGLDEGETRDTGDGYLVHFGRDLIWTPVPQVWEVLTGGAEVRPGGPVPAGLTSPAVPAGTVTAVAAPDEVEYAWLHDGQVAGQVRWLVVHDPLVGTRVEITQTVPAALAALRPAALAAWHVRLDRLFAAVQGREIDVPPDREADLVRRYTERYP